MNAKEELTNAAFAIARAARRIYEKQGISEESLKLCERLDRIALELFAYIRRLK